MKTNDTAMSFEFQVATFFMLFYIFHTFHVHFLHVFHVVLKIIFFFEMLYNFAYAKQIARGNFRNWVFARLFFQMTRGNMIFWCNETQSFFDFQLDLQMQENLLDGMFSL